MQHGDWGISASATVNSLSVGITAACGAMCGRSEICGFSRKSAIRLGKYLESAEAEYSYLGTFTLREFNGDGPGFKRRLDVFLRAFMRLQGSKGTDSACWFLEFQARGVPHIHMFYTTPVPWRDAAMAWCRAFDCPESIGTCSKLETLRSGRSGAVSYAKKYAGKGAGGDLDELAQEFGVSETLGEGDRYLAVTDAMRRAGDKRYQKLVPPWFGAVGRFWGIRGLRSVMAAAMSVPAEMGGIDLYKSILALMISRARACARGENGSTGCVKLWRWTKGVGVKCWGWGDAFRDLAAQVALLVAEHSKQWGTSPFQLAGGTYASSETVWQRLFGAA